MQGGGDWVREGVPPMEGVTVHKELGIGGTSGAGAASDFALIQVKHLTRCEPSRISAIHSCGIHLMPAHAAIKGKARKAERERERD